MSMADVMAPGEPVQRLIQAVKLGQNDEVQVLVDSTPQLAAARDASGVSAVLLALYHGHPDIARWLASRRSDLDIFEAAALGDDGRVRAQLSSDPALAHARSADGFTALGLASFFGQLPIVRALLEAGSDVNAVGRNPGRYTPLTGAVAAGAVEVVRELLEHGADANYRYGAGYTPLHAAAAGGNEEVVRLLVDAGASCGACTDEGQTPVELARQKGHARLVAWLEERCTR